MVNDPYYQDGPFTWAIPRVEAITGHRVHVDEHLGSTVIIIDSPGKRIRIRPGLTMFQVAGLLTLATWRIIGGPEWVPDFRVIPRLRAIPSQREPIDNVVQLQNCPTCKSTMRRA